MSKKNPDLQPWLDYFSMLMTHEEQGLVEIMVDKHEAYLTQPALHAITPGDDPQQQAASGALIDTARRLMTYAAWKSQQGKDYLAQSFAVIVVSPGAPHDPLYAIHLSPNHGILRRWFRRDYEVNVIDYTEQPKHDAATSTSEVPA